MRTSTIAFIIAIFIMAGLVSAIDWSPQGNVNLKNRYNITNWAVGNCSGTDVVIGIDANGDWVCSAAGAGDITGINTDGDYLDGSCSSGTCNLTVNMSNMNDTMDLRYRLESWDNFTGIPLATPSNGDITHLSTANQIYDWVIGLNYKTLTEIITSIGNWSSDKGDYYTSTQTDTAITNANTSMKSYVDSQDTSYNDSLKSYTDSQDVVYNDSMKTYVDSQDTVFNTSLKEYADAQDVVYNNSMKTYADSRDITFNDSMKTYVDSQDIVFNTSLKDYTDGMFILQSEEGNLNVNHSNSTSYWDDVDTPDDFVNITLSGIIKGQPMTGGIGSGVIECSENLGHCGCSNITANSDLEVHYPEFEMRVVKTDGTEIHCSISEGDINVTDNQHSTYYLNSSCEWNFASFANFHNEDMHPGGRARIFDVLAVNGVVEEVKGNTLLYLAKDKSEQVRIFCPSTSHLTVCNGFDITQDTFPSFNVSSGNSVYLNTYLPSDAKSTLLDETHLTHHENGDWTHTNTNGFNVTHCDNGTDLVECTGTVFRQYPVYSISWNSGAIIHMLSPLTSGNTYTSLSACKEASPDYTLPDMEEYVAIVHHIYCARRTDSVWDSNAWVDLRVAPVGTGGSPDLSIYLVEGGTRPLIGNWNQGAYNFTNTDSWWLGKIDWSTIQNKFITAAADVYIYMSGTTVTLNETKLNATIDDRDSDTTYDNASPIGLSGTTFDFIACGDTEIRKYNGTSSAWECEPDATAESGMASWVLAASDTAGTESITDGETVTFADDSKYLNATRSTNTVTYTLYETKLNETIDARDSDTIYTAEEDLIYLDGTEFKSNETVFNETVEAFGYSTTTGTVTSVATDDTYLTGGAITTTGTITFNTTLAGTSLAVDSADKWDALDSPSDINAADITDDGTYRLESWDNLTGIPHATPSNGDVTHFSLADEIYDWGVGLFMQDSDINTFSELQSWVSDKTLVNEEDVATIEANWVNTANPWDISTETNLAVGNGITLTGDTLTVVGGTALTADAGGLSVTAGGIGDTQLAFNTGQALTTTSTPTFATLSTGQGQYELYAMNQDVESTDAVTFATIDTGEGANELYDMNQNVLTTSNPTFNNVTITECIPFASGGKICDLA